VRLIPRRPITSAPLAILISKRPKAKAQNCYLDKISLDVGNPRYDKSLDMSYFAQI
jgi:hypothetical protein